MCWTGNIAEYASRVFRECVFVFKDWRHTSQPLQVHSLHSPKYLANQAGPLLIFIDLILTCMWKLATSVPLQPGRPGIYLTNPLSSRPISHNIETTCLWLFSDCWSKTTQNSTDSGFPAVQLEECVVWFCSWSWHIKRKIRRARLNVCSVPVMELWHGTVDVMAERCISCVE